MKKKTNENHFTVREPRIFLLFHVLVFLYLWGLFITNTIIFSILIVLGLLLIIHSYSWKLRVEGDRIVYTPFVGIRKEFTISSITRVKIRHGELKVYSENKKLFSVKRLKIGHKQLSTRLQKEEHIQFDF
jgi:hypothetical protein